MGHHPAAALLYERGERGATVEPLVGIRRPLARCDQHHAFPAIVCALFSLQPVGCLCVKAFHERGGDRGHRRDAACGLGWCTAASTEPFWTRCRPITGAWIVIGLVEMELSLSADGERGTRGRDWPSGQAFVPGKPVMVFSCGLDIKSKRPCIAMCVKIIN